MSRREHCPIVEYAEDSILNIAPDPRWTHAQLRIGSADDRSAPFVPFVGWAVVVRTSLETETGIEQVTEIRPAFLIDGKVEAFDDLQMRGMFLRFRRITTDEFGEMGTWR